MIRLTDIRKSFGTTQAVDGLTLEIRQGEVFGLLGPNGAGKTTTVNIMVGLLAPDQGSMMIENRGSPLQAHVRSCIGLAPQSLAIYEDLTARENLIFLGRLQGLFGRTLKERVDRALEFVGLHERARDRGKTYSGGMKRRLNLACALVHDPHPPLDEPTAGVDPQSRNALFENIDTLRAEGRTVVYTTHYMEEAQRLCDRVAIMDHGRLLALDTVEGLIKTHGGLSTLVMQSDGEETSVVTADPLAELMRMNKEGGLESFRVDRPNLEQVFLNLTGRKLRDG